MSKYFELLEQAGHEQELFRTSSGPSEHVRKPIPTLSKDPPQGMLKGTSLPIHWLNQIKEGVRTWRQQVLKQVLKQVQIRNGHPGTDRDLITREEEFKLVQRVFRPASGPSPQVVLFCGVEADAGSASICAHTSEILAAQPEELVCVVDANFHSPCLHKYFGLENCRGLAEALLEPGPIQEFVQQASEPKLWVMPSGLATAQVSRVVSDRLRSRMAELRAAFKRVVIRSSPFGLDTDPIVLSQWTDGVVLVVEANSTRRDTARRVKENIEVAGVRLLGVVLNNRTFPIPDAL
jgi:protein-tyrosine kinase